MIMFSVMTLSHDPILNERRRLERGLIKSLAACTIALTLLWETTSTLAAAQASSSLAEPALRMFSLMTLGTVSIALIASLWQFWRF
jgi:hypothetical protein